jgi:LacI family transcriptional regulator, galactose operon repressor
MTIRMKDIARDLGLSVVTVSKVLRDHPDIGEETRKRVLQRVKELDYEPNILARSLVTGRSYLIGLIVPGLIHPFFAEIAKALSKTIVDKGYSLIVSSSEEDPELEAREIRHLLARRLDALVIASSGKDTQLFRRMQSQSQPFVLIDRIFDDLEADFVGIDDVAAGRMATTHLIEMGRKHIAHISGRENSTGVRRKEGYLEALRAHKLPVREDYILSRDFVDTDSQRQGSEAMRQLLERNPRPDAVFCHNDPIAIGAMNVILDAGLRIPEDVALVGCGNLNYSEWLRVPLTSIDQRSHLIGQRAGEILLAMIEGREWPAPSKVILEPALVVRASTTGGQAESAKVTGKARKKAAGARK